MKKVFWCILALALLLLIIVSSTEKHNEVKKARAVFVRMFGFDLPDNAQINVFNYNRLTDEAYFDIIISDQDVEKVITNVYGFLQLQTNRDISTLKDERENAQESLLTYLEKYRFFLYVCRGDFPRLTKRSGKGYPMMEIAFTEEEKTGVFHLLISWWV